MLSLEGLPTGGMSFRVMFRAQRDYVADVWRFEPHASACADPVMVRVGSSGAFHGSAEARHRPDPREVFGAPPLLPPWLAGVVGRLAERTGSLTSARALLAVSGVEGQEPDLTTIAVTGSA